MSPSEVEMTELPLPSLKARTADGVDLLTDDALFYACGVRVAFPGRAGGTSEGPYASLNTASHVDDDPVHVRAKVDDVSAGDIPMSAVLLDIADAPYSAFGIGGIENEFRVRNRRHRERGRQEGPREFAELRPGQVEAGANDQEGGLDRHD